MLLLGRSSSVPDSIGFKHTHPWKPESGSLQKCPCCALISTQSPRGVFVKTVFSTFETFDSALVERMRGLCHLFVKRYLQLLWRGQTLAEGQLRRTKQHVAEFFETLMPELETFISSLSGVFGSYALAERSHLGYSSGKPELMAARTRSIRHSRPPNSAGLDGPVKDHGYDFCRRAPLI